MTRYALFFFLAALAGCSTIDAAVDTAKTQAAGNDRYTQLAAEALAGTANPSTGVAPVSTQDLADTPASVELLCRRLLEALHANRYAAHSTVYQLDAGPDPDTLALDPLEWPSAPDEDDDLLEED